MRFFFFTFLRTNVARCTYAPPTETLEQGIHKRMQGVGDQTWNSAKPFKRIPGIAHGRALYAVLFRYMCGRLAPHKLPPRREEVIPMFSFFFRFPFTKTIFFSPHSYRLFFLSRLLSNRTIAFCSMWMVFNLKTKRN